MAILALRPWFSQAPTLPIDAAKLAHLQIMLPPGLHVAVGTDQPAMAISPDGSRVAHVAEEHGVRRLYIRDLADSESRAVSDTEGALAPFFSPDGAWIGFFDGRLKQGRGLQSRRPGQNPPPHPRYKEAPMYIRRAALAALTLLFLASQASSQASRSDDSAARGQTASVMQKYVAAMKAGDARALAQFFAPDGITAGFNQEVRAQDQEAYWVETFKTLTWEDVTYTTEELAVVGDTAYDFGVWNQRLHRNAGGDPITQRLRSFTAWRRQSDGAWKIHRQLLTVARPRTK